MMTKEEELKLAKDMLEKPEKYGLTKDFLRQWYINNLGNGADILCRISADEADRLSDALIDVYKERGNKSPDDS